MSESARFAYRRLSVRSSEKDFTGEFPSFDAALAAAIADRPKYFLKHGSVEIGELVKYPSNTLFMSAAKLIDETWHSAHFEMGEFATEYLQATEEAESELHEQLHELLNAWCDKHNIDPHAHKVINVQTIECTDAIAQTGRAA